MDAYSLSPSTKYHLDDNRFQSNSHAVFTHVHAGQENAILTFMFSNLLI
ncbi:MAG: hypothetical protein WCG25_01920 [bacterium]